MSELDYSDDFSELDDGGDDNDVNLPTDKAVLEKLFGSRESEPDGESSDVKDDAPSSKASDGTASDLPAGDDWDADLLAEANMHGISAARARTFGSPDNLRDYLTVRSLAAQYMTGNEPEAKKDTKDDFQEFKVEIQDEDLKDSEIVKHLKAMAEHNNNTLRAMHDRLKAEREHRQKLEAEYRRQREAEAQQAETELAMKFVKSVEGLQEYSWLFGQDLKTAMKKGGEEGNRVRKLARHYRIAALAAREAGEELPDIAEAVSELVPVVFRKEIADRAKKYERARDNGKFVSAPPNGQASREKGARGGRLREIFAEFSTGQPSGSRDNDEI